MPDDLPSRPTATDGACAGYEAGTDPDIQRQRFDRACELLGGNHAAGRALDLSERTIRALRKGERQLHDGTLERTARALIAHADACRALERRISPAFAKNLTTRQQGPADMRGRHNRKVAANG